MSLTYPLLRRPDAFTHREGERHGAGDAWLLDRPAARRAMAHTNRHASRSKVDRSKHTALQGVDIDESLPVAEQLRAALAASSMKVITLFREWDDDESGCVSRKEFHVGMKQLGLDFPKEAMDTLYDEWDPDGSGHLELSELSKQLRRGADVQLAAHLQVGGAGEIVLKSANATALRTAKKVKGRASMIQGVDIDESKPVCEQLRAVLVAKAVRVIDLFREWDDDESGAVSRKEFCTGLKDMGLDFPRKAMDELFDEWDPDGSGELEFRELSKKLRRGIDINLNTPARPTRGVFAMTEEMRPEQRFVSPGGGGGAKFSTLAKPLGTPGDWCPAGSVRGPQVLQLPRVRAPAGSPPPVRSSLEQVRDSGGERRRAKREREKRSGEREREVEREREMEKDASAQIER